MASAHKVPAVTRTEVVEVEPERYVLELTPYEALSLREIMGALGYTSPNKYVQLGDAIYDALVNEGVPTGKSLRTFTLQAI